MHVSCRLQNLRIFNPNPNPNLSLSIYIFMSVRQTFTEFRAQVHKSRRQRVQPVCFLHFTKAQCFVVIVSAHK